MFEQFFYCNLFYGFLNHISSSRNWFFLQILLDDRVEVIGDEVFKGESFVIKLISIVSGGVIFEGEVGVSKS